MIVVFFNENGYCISGGGVEVSRRCLPALTEQGDKIFQTIHHMYKIIYLALGEIGDLPLKDDVMVYNSSRIIDELNGVVQPLDEICNEWLNIINRHSIPNIKTVVIFRKKPEWLVETEISNAHNSVFNNATAQKRSEIAARNQMKAIVKQNNRNKSILENFKTNWINEKQT